MSAGKNFFNFPQQHYNIFQQIFHIITPSKYQYKITAKIIIHHSPKNVKRGGGNRKNGGLQGWLEMSIPLTRNWRSFSVSLYTYNALLSAFDKVPFSHFPQYWFISSSRVYNHIVVVYWKFVEFHYCIILIVVLYTTNYIRVAKSEKRKAKSEQQLAAAHPPTYQ